MPYVPSLHLVQEKADALSLEGHDVHTFNLVLHDGYTWQVVIGTTDQSMENHEFKYNLDAHGWNLVEAEVHYA